VRGRDRGVGERREAHQILIVVNMSHPLSVVTIASIARGKSGGVTDGSRRKEKSEFRFEAGMDWAKVLGNRVERGAISGGVHMIADPSPTRHTIDTILIWPTDKSDQTFADIRREEMLERTREGDRGAVDIKREGMSIINIKMIDSQETVIFDPLDQIMRRGRP
jgi:hypothetical protein